MQFYYFCPLYSFCSLGDITRQRGASEGQRRKRGVPGGLVNARWNLSKHSKSGSDAYFTHLFWNLRFCIIGWLLTKNILFDAQGHQVGPVHCSAGNLGPCLHVGSRILLNLQSICLDLCKIHCSRESATSGFHLPDIPLRPANICRGSCRFSSASDFKCLLIFLFWIPKSGTLNYAFWIFDRNVFLRKKLILNFPRCGKLLPQYLPCCWLGYRLNVQISWYLQTLHNIRAICNAY